MEYYVTSSEIDDDLPAQQLYTRLKDVASDRTGYTYYKYPLAGGINNYLPAITVIDKEHGMVVFDAYEWDLSEISSINDEVWTVDDDECDSPLARLDDYEVSIVPKYRKFREIRNKIGFNSYAIFPLISKIDFVRKFPNADVSKILFSDYLEIPYLEYWVNSQPLNDDEYEVFISVSQGASVLNDYKPANLRKRHLQLGDAIRNLNTKIALLDKEQHAAAIQIPEGVQRIRGLAGTGKTVILAMKAAYFHQRYPNRKILYTFHTQSLYNIVKRLITKFYRQTEDRDPNWDNLIVMHSWGGKSKEGTYSWLCAKNNVEPMTLSRAKLLNPDSDSPFSPVCSSLLQYELKELFDFVLIDEAQDLPQPFFELLHRVTKWPKRIVYAYDELQSLNSQHLPDANELFGNDAEGGVNVDFRDTFYANNIDMDIVLKKSYRNPLEVLMVAHGIGLGIYNDKGLIQMVDRRDVWSSIGYEIESGELEVGNRVVLNRPSENSPNLLSLSYSGTIPSLTVDSFDTREEEIDWIVSNIENDIKNEGVPPEEIVVITLDPSNTRSNYIPIQRKLFEKDINSMIPGVDAERDQFTEAGFVTLSTVYKAKGNEAAIVYVMNFDFLYNYTKEISARNMAFTSITRAKGWCHISGTGLRMKRALTEVNKIQEKIPKFEFTFPDMAQIRRLSTEVYARREHEVQRAKDLLEQLLGGDEDALRSLPDSTKDALRRKMDL